MAKLKVQVTFDEDLLNGLDQYCDQNHTNRSAAVTMGVIKLLNEQKIVDSVPRIAVLLQKLYDDKCLDQGAKEELENMVALVKLYQTGK